MRKWFVIGAATALVVVAVAVLWPRDEPPPTPVAPVARVLPEFESVEVFSSGASEGLTLTGRVLDSRGAPVVGAEVFLSASAQKTLTSVRCDECGEALLACPARESGLHALAFFEQARGFLQPKATVRTDAQGRFRFEHLAGVSFSVWARASGFGAAMRERAAPGEPVDLYLPPLRSIGGQVVDEAGRGLPGAHVYAVSRKVPLPSEAVAGPDGSFTLSGLGEGPFYVLATASGFLPAVEPLVEAGPQPVRLRLEPSRTLEVRVTHRGEPVTATVRLKADHLAREVRAEGGVARFEDLYPDELVVSAEAGRLGAAPRTLTLSERLTQVTLELEEAGTLLVTVVDEAGQPVPSPELVVRTARGRPIQTQKPSTGELVQFGPLAVGDYVLEGRAKGFRDAQLPARVKPGETSLELELERATLITGQVLDQYGRPAPNVSVLVQPTGDAVLADAEGHFSAAVPTPGLYELHAHHSEWGGGQVKVTAPAEGVRLELEPRASLEVTVMGEGRRLEGADVLLWVDNEGIFRSDSSSGPDGMVPMRGLPPGTYSMVATHPDYLPSERQKVVVEDGQTQRVTVTLEPGEGIQGEVVDTRGMPVEGASVSVLPRMAEPVTTDAQGRFEVRALKPGRPFLVEARHSGYDQRERVQGTPGGEPVRVVMEARGTFRGRVVAEDGEPVRRFRLDEHDVTSQDGRFEVALPTAGDRVIVSVEAAGFEPLMVDKPAQPNDLGDLVLVRAPSVTGLVRDEGGGPVADAVVGCDACEDSVMTGPDGRFTLPSPPFVAKFSVTARKGRLSASASASREGPRTVELVLKPATRLSGTVYRPDGTPAAGFQLEGVHADRGEPISIVTGPDGRYSVDVAPGHYRFALGVAREFSGEPALLVQVEGGEKRLDIGPAPGTASLTVQLKSERGKALWVIAGDMGAVGNPPKELIRARYGQLLYQPRGERITLQGFPPGRYTLVWSNFHTDTEDGPVVRTVDLPTSGDVVLTP
ncbi:carboxypeptidase regulatory-like domain-containing protein [Archangium violaceum]|uniref:carboxypeptidase regulatory-like domain-containing protein n=1 Tax=Archangium violaceum TaxID=83451 RepID=UPI00193B421F|nr:carboxypeptidase regulatory-like domain-containing protein [Archangium violaceum]QRK05634.1 carboxypeptidase regulatory-like domain-containing protein [Archangium violaceum]